MKRLISWMLAMSFPGFMMGQMKSPVLKLNTAMHTSRISRISVDLDEKYILSCSDDKTAKLWDAKSGVLIKTFHVPIDNGLEGSLTAGAISPDGKTALLGGFTGFTWNKTYSVYIFDVGENKWITQIKDLSDPVSDIEFSYDGKFAAVALSNNGIRIFETTKWSQVQSFKNYEGTCANLAFDKTGRLATVCLDGKIRLYSNSFELIKERETDGGKEPYSLAFSPDGGLLAVGYMDSYKIQVFSGNNLRKLYEPEISGYKSLTQSFFIVSFSCDGEYLIAGGNYDEIDFTNKNADYLVRVWPDKGKGTSQEYKAGRKTISDIKPLKDNAFLFCSLSPDLGCLKMDGTTVFINRSELNSYNTSFKGNFKVNHDATEIGIDPALKTNLTFSVSNRLLSVKNIENANASVTSWKDIEITDWCASYEPKINSKPLSFLAKGEMCYCADIDYDTKRIVFGTSWNIYCTDFEGKILWSATSNSTVWSVNIAEDHKTLVACFDDGTIQWYRMDKEVEFRINEIMKGSVAEKSGLLENDIILNVDNTVFNVFEDFKNFTKEKKSYQFKIQRENKEKVISVDKNQDMFGFQFTFYKSNLLFTLYPHPDNKSWVLWTTNGYFDCSEGADRLIGWHVNQGPDKEALYYPASQFFEKFYSPNLGARILTGENVKSPDMVQTNFTLPPLTKIITPSTNSTLTNELLKIIVKTTDQGGGIDEVRLYHNGKLLDGTTRGFKSTGQNHEFMVMLTNGENRIKATAFNSQRTESIPDEIVVNYKAPEIVKPNMHILAVGINNYLNPKYNLNYAKNDADAFVKSLSAGASSLFGKVEVTTINDNNATKAGILAAIEKIKSASKAEDVFVFYYAGHGVMSSGTGVEKPLFYLVPHDVTKMYEADEILKKLGISASEIGEFSKTIKAQKQLFVIDACQSGGAMQTLAMRGASEEKAIAQLARSTGTYFIAASGTEQFATEVAELGHGIFTYSVIEALKGSCKSQDGKITVNLLKSCVEDLVPELSKKHKGQPQFPTGYGFGMDFPVVMVK